MSPIRHAVAVTLAAACLAGVGAQVAPSQGPRNAAEMRLVLARTLPNVELDEVALDDALDFLRDVTAANIVVDWDELELMGVDRSTPVSLRLGQVRVRQLLTLMLQQAGDGLAFYAEDNVVYVTTQDEADRNLVTLVYPVQDLLMVVPDFVPDFDFGGGGGGGGGGGLGGGNGGGGGGDGQSENVEERAEELMQLIRDTIRPEIWRENGGPASIRYFRGSLIVTAPLDVHDALL